MEHSSNVQGRGFLHIRNAAFEAVSALEQSCSVPLLKVEHYIPNSLLKWSQDVTNDAMEPHISTLSFQIKREHCKLYDG